MPHAPRWTRFMVAAMCAALLYFPALGRAPLWEPDEGRYAEIGREMALTGDYITPRDDWQRYFEKPPLVYWAEAASIRILGPTEYAVRLPAAVFSVGQVVLTAALAESIAGPEVALAAAAVIALSPIFFIFARFATLDPALAFFLTAAMAAVWRAMRQPSLDSRVARRAMILASACVALGTLAKGPVAIVLGAAITIIWMAVERRLTDIRRISLLKCAIVYLVIAAPWFIAMELRNRGFIHFFAVHEHLQRFTTSHEHAWGPWFFLPIVVGGMWPWIFFAPIGVRSLSTSAAAPLRSGFRFLAVWFAVVLIFFSIPRSKLGAYILPAIPPMAIICGCGLNALVAMTAQARSRLLAWFAASNGAIAAAGAIAGLWIFHAVNPGLAADACVVAAIIGVGGLILYGTNRTGGPIGYGVAAMALAMVAVVAFGERAREDAVAMVSFRRLSSAIAPMLRDKCVLGSYHHYVQSIPFYTGYPETRVEYGGELAEGPDNGPANLLAIGTTAKFRDLWRSGVCVVLIVNRKDYPALAPTLVPTPTIVGCEGKKLAIANRPATTPAPECIAATP